jgi:hypothetical protein
MTNDFITLEEYALCIKECLENVLFDHQMADDEKPLVTYATSSIAYAKLQERFANGQNIGPLITFYQSGIDLIQEQQMGAWKWMTVARETGNYQMRAPVICSINYTVTISALTERQADMLQTQIMMATPFHRPYYIKLKGQYVLIQNTEVSNLSSVDVGDNKDRVSQRQIILKIDRAYLDYDYKELYAGTISPSTEAFNYNDEDVSKELKNGAKILKDNTTVVDGTVNKNTSNSFAPFIYNVLDEKGNVIQTTQKGKSKVTLYSLEKTL